ncbi:MAG: PQQ-like beta-propeller repeat protein [Pirellulales bacterium]|nr:PQQ-like beta-propeller repeat protein [Pirellulales bacterium]
MRSAAFVILIPGTTAVAAAALLVFWMAGPHVAPLSARVPGTDRPAEGEAQAAAPLVGTLTQGKGKPSDLPGAWPRFRGERFNGIAAQSAPLARQWPAEGPQVLWSVNLGEGHAGAAVRDGRVFVLDYDRDGEADVLRCLSLDDGREIWSYRYPVKIKRNHGMSRTVPAVSDQYVVALGPKCHVSCLDPKTGECYWLIDMVRKFGATVPPWYAGQCPLIDGDRAILAPGGDALVLALDCRTGDVVWRSPNPRAWTMTHASIAPMEFAGRKMYVYCGRGGVAGVSADDGKLLWDSTDWKISIATVPSPVILPEGKIFFSGGYNSGALMMQLEDRDGALAAKTIFRLKPNRFGSEQQTPIFHEGHLFGVRQSDDQLVCLDLAGNEVWASGPKHRFGLGPYLIADGLIFALEDLGFLTVAEATPAGFRPLAQAQVLQGHDAWGPMALVHGWLLARDLTRMVCLDVSAEGMPPAAKEGQP